MHTSKKSIVSGQRLKLAGANLTLFNYGKGVQSGMYGGQKSFYPDEPREKIVYTPEEIEKRSQRRAYNKIVDSVNCNVTEKSSFMLLTSPLKITELHKLQKRYKNFLHLLDNYVGYSVKKSSVVELSSTSATLHMHVVLFDVPKLDKEKLEEMWGYFVKIKKLRRGTNVGRYMAKYLSKGDLQIPYRKRYQQSKNLLQPIVTAVEEVVSLVRSLLPSYLPLYNYSYRSFFFHNVDVVEVNLIDYPSIRDKIKYYLTEFAL